MEGAAETDLVALNARIEAALAAGAGLGISVVIIGEWLATCIIRHYALPGPVGSMAVSGRARSEGRTALSGEPLEFSAENCHFWTRFGRAREPKSG